MIRLAVDAMGGDHAPEAMVAGAELARDQHQDLEILLFGDEQQLQAQLKDSTRIKIKPTTEMITMEDEPVRAVKGKRDSSIVQAALAVKNGAADALVSAGSTGALMVVGLLMIGRIKGIDRPGLTVTMPVIDNEIGFTMIDAGANADAKLDNIRQYATLGTFYAENVRKVKHPRVGLINNGSEADKGDIAHQKMHDMLVQMGENGEINFIGNIESRYLLNGVADVVVTDGFSGNVALKATEGSALAVINMLKTGIKTSGLRGKLGALLLKRPLQAIAKKMDYTRYGGAVLLGLQSPVIKGHGNSTAKMFKNCLDHAYEIASSGYTEAVKEYLLKSAVTKQATEK
ncbi:Phosphate acyl-ACP acyltransferase PlsX [Fructilactobacillus florum 8D]|uniref:Phosphate acyltransferase n=2 Tax=Fructilactobacillus florum TaxID=640331 RepID=W9EDJ8_9LACO|nr:phosphate acyltransferase PlsX [Fructilactobacillus florum]ETO40203.1 Phosphate acyl-ACP acyltransferase PlsX [Fructilactobacillus florum 8D]KRM91780.1 fatty acid phospholipid synthesis protein PlsX [Fructilactobacillus florum DSM 22689 = JCM 16035]